MNNGSQGFPTRRGGVQVQSWAMKPNGEEIERLVFLFSVKGEPFISNGVSSPLYIYQGISE